MSINIPFRLRYLRTAAATVLVAVSACSWQVKAEELEPLLQRLDTALKEKETYVEARKSRISMLEEMLSRSNVDDEQYYSINMQLYHEYEAFRFDESMTCLNKNLEIAKRLRSHDKINETYIMLASLYTNAGMYFEANEIFSHHIDTLRISDEQRTAYYLARQKLCFELGCYSKEKQIVEQSFRQYHYYASLLLKNPDSDDAPFNVRLFRLQHMITECRFDEAERLGLDMLDEYADSTHQYAIITYNLGVICDKTERREEMAAWYARSAFADVCTATKDNASLCSLANQLFGMHDVMRAFRYIRVSMDDAIFYNAKLRPWQVAASMPHIEQAAQELELSRMRQTRTYTIIISVLLFALVIACVYLYRLYARARRNQRMLRERNEQIDKQNNELSCLNSEIIEANHVKEEYIGLFLSICSEYIDRLIESQRNVRRKLSSGKVAELQREVSSFDMVEEETKRFYKIFDTAFLSLYPTFVEDFNSLLVDSEHIEPHKGELLNTELRIFALIRLGITDSSKIASLLRYSVNTIYNYRAKVKNKAKHDREDFEEQVKHIGSFRK